MPNHNGGEHSSQQREVTSERRQSERKRPEKLVYVQLERDNGGMMLNVSEGGLSLRAMGLVRREAEVHFAIKIDAQRQFEGQGRMEWAQEDGRVGGMQFTEVSPEFREELRRWLSESDVSPERERRPVPAAAPPVVPPAVDRRKELLPETKAEFDKSVPVPAEPERTEVSSQAPLVEAPVAASTRQSDVATSKLPEQPRPGVEEKIATIPIMHAEADATMPSPAIHSSGATQASSETSSMPESIVRGKQMQPLDRVPLAAPVAFESRDLPPIFGEPRENEGQRIPEFGFGGSSGTPDYSAPPNRAPLLTAVVIGVAVLVATVFFFHRDVGQSLIWLGEKMAGESRPARLPAPEAPPDASQKADAGAAAADTSTESTDKGVTPGQTQPAANPAASKSNEAGPATPLQTAQQNAPQNTRQNASQAKASGAPANSPATPPATPKSDAPAPSSAAPEVEPGQSELTTAEQLLTNNEPASTSRAVQLLWTSVEKGNSGAISKLAELYILGGVIPKNCAQAHVLLRVAAKKGDAGTRAELQRLYQQGCG